MEEKHKKELISLFRFFTNNDMKDDKVGMIQKTMIQINEVHCEIKISENMNKNKR